jgi:pilus assembly protein Flp/PilA
MKKLFNTFLQDEQGQDLVEYALLLAFIALAAVSVLGGLKTTINSMFIKVNSTLTSASR